MSSRKIPGAQNFYALWELFFRFPPDAGDTATIAELAATFRTAAFLSEKTLTASNTAAFIASDRSIAENTPVLKMNGLSGKTVVFILFLLYAPREIRARSRLPLGNLLNHNIYPLSVVGVLCKKFLGVEFGRARCVHKQRSPFTKGRTVEF